MNMLRGRFVLRLPRHRVPVPIISAASEQTGSGSTGLSEIAQLDTLIDALLACKDANELGQTVAQNITSCDQRFWLRLATRSDCSTSVEEREQLQSLAKVVMQLVDTILKKTNQQLNESGAFLQAILKAAADPSTGEWSLPLSDGQIDAMSVVMKSEPEKMDEALLSNCFAWIKKASDDGLDGMVALIQTVLQLYAAIQLSQQLSRPANDSVDAFVLTIITSAEKKWDEMLERSTSSISGTAFMDALQKRMEGVVLGLPTGSYAQRVQAEYLKELEDRAKRIYNIKE